MLIQEFFNNPAGKGSAMLNIKATKAEYDKRYDSFCKHITHQVFLVKDDIYILVRIPSSVDGILYDVVIKFFPNQTSGGNSILDMDFQIFSNSPSFVFTYAHAYYKRHMLIKELNRKLSRDAIKLLAESRNPYNVISYDYTVYCAIKYILLNEYTTLESFKKDSRTVESKSISALLHEIHDFDTLQKQRGMQKSHLKALEEEEKREAKKIKYNSKKDSNVDKNTENIKKVQRTKNTKTTKSVSKTTKTKKIK